MIVQCSAERLQTADKFEPIARHQEGLRRAIKEIMPPGPIEVSAGQLAVEAAAYDSDEVVGSLTPDPAGVCVAHYPGGVVSAFSYDFYDGTAGNLL